MTVKAYHDFYDQASDLGEAAELYLDVARPLEIRLSNVPKSPDGPSAKVLERIAELTAELAPRAEAFERLAGVPHSKKAAYKFKCHAESIQALPEPVVKGVLRPACDKFPAHYAGPSGLPTLGVVTLIFSAAETGKRVLVQDGQVVATKAPIDLSNAKAELAHKTSGETGKFRPAKGFEVFVSAACVGFGNLDDARHWLTVAGGANGYIVRAPLRPDYAPAAIGLRRAMNTDAKYGLLDRPAFEDGASKLLIFDLDNIPPPEGLDYHDLDALTALALAYLPVELQGAEFLISPTTGHGRPSEAGPAVRLRVVAIADRPLGRVDLTAWAQPVAGNIGCDPAVYKSAQPVYTSRICLDAATLKPVADPFAALVWRKVPGTPLVAVPEIDLTPVATTGKVRAANDNEDAEPRATRAPRAKGEKVTAEHVIGALDGMSLQATLDAIGDDGAGFNAPMVRAAYKMVGDRRHEPTPERAEEIRKIIEAYILTADTSKREGNKQPEEYIGQLPGLIASLIGREPERRRAQAYGESFERIEQDALEAAVANVAPLPTASLEEAQAVAKHGLETWLALHAEVPFGGWQKAPERRARTVGASFEWFDEELDEADLADLTTVADGYTFAEAPSEPLGAEVEPAVAQTEASLSNALHGVLQVKASDLSAKEKAEAIVEVSREQGVATARPSLVMKVGAGIGKTKTLIDRVNLATAEGDPRRFAFTFPEHGLAAESMAQVDGGAVYKGMDHEGMCLVKMAPIRRKAQLLGATPEGFCRTCPGRISSDPNKRCEYWKQSETLRSTKVLGFAHGLRAMAHPLPTPCKEAGLKVPDVLISDEGALAELIAEEFVALNDFFLDFGLFVQAKEYLTEEAKKSYGKTTFAYEAIEQWVSIVRHDFTHGDTSEGVALTLERMRKLRPRFGPSLFASLLVRLEDCTGGMALANDAEAKKILEAWNAPLKRAQKLCAGLRAMDLRPGLGAPSDSMIVPGWSFTSKKITTSDGEGEFPGLSFSYRAGVSKEWGRTALILLDATVREEAKAILAPGAAVVSAVAREVAGAVTRHVRFTPSGNNSARHLPAYIDRWGRAMSALGSVGIVMAKETESAILKTYIAPDVPPYLLLHHGATRGRNAMEGCRIGAVFGRQLIAPEDRAVMVTALSGRPVKVGENADVAAAWSIRDGSGLGGARWGDTQGGLADDLARGAEDCVIQAEARFRAVRRTAADPLTAFVHVDRVVEGLTVDTVAGAVAERVSLGDETLVTDFVRVAAEIGFVPVGKSGARFFRQAFDLEAKAWENARLRFEGGPVTPHFPYVQEEESKQIENEGLRVPPLGEWLDGLADAAKATARQDAATKVLRVETVHGPATVVCLTDEATAVPGRMGLASEVLTGKARTKALRVRTDAAAPDTVADEAPAAADALPLAA